MGFRVNVWNFDNSELFCGLLFSYNRKSLLQNVHFISRARVYVCVNMSSNHNSSSPDLILSLIVTYNMYNYK